MGKNSDRLLVGIPTRERPEYLTLLLSSLFTQSYQQFDILIVAGGGDDLGYMNELPLSRFVKAFQDRGIKVMTRLVPGVGRSEATAVNRILFEAVTGSYSYVYKVDDDHVLPSNTLEELLSDLEQLEDEDDSLYLVSGVTPWMKKVWDGASGPGDDVKVVLKEHRKGSMVFTDCWVDADLGMEIGHFDRYLSSEVVRTKLASAANFMMRPDIRLLWSDIGESSKYADAIWFLQLQKFLGYKLYIDTGVEAWHVVAPTGGVREQADALVKESSWDKDREVQLCYSMIQFGMDDRGISAKEEETDEACSSDGD